jgi:RNA polymerase sigma factor (sigma-70 family)
MHQAMDALERERRFAEWTTRHAAIFHRVANAFARGADRDDLMQELLLATWKAIPAFRQGSLPSTFLYRVTHNAALTWKRGERTRQERAARFETLAVGDGATAPSDGTAEGDLEGQLRRLYQAIRELPAVDRSLLLLSLDGVPYAEMAAIHGLSVSHVGVRLTRARQSLATRLQGGST